MTPDFSRQSQEGTAKHQPLEEALAVISCLAQRGGPKSDEYALFWQACSGFSQAKAGGHISEDEHREFIASLGAAGTAESLMGHIFHKPYGYAGDFEIIDKLYTHHISSHPMVTRWDEFVQAVPSSQSVRNRGSYLLQTVVAMLDHHESDRPLSVVSLGSGPGRDVEHVLDGVEDVCKRIRVNLVDIDDRALAHSRKVLARFDGAVRHLKSDVLHLRLEEPVDLIWSSGLFDYFSDRAFVTVLRRMTRMIAPGGQLVVGNFSERCASHGPMAFVNWHLIVRSEAELMKMAFRAGVPRVRIGAEPVGLNLFLHAENVE